MNNGMTLEARKHILVGVPTMQKLRLIQEDIVTLNQVARALDDGSLDSVPGLGKRGIEILRA